MNTLFNSDVNKQHVDTHVSIFLYCYIVHVWMLIFIRINITSISYSYLKLCHFIQ